MDDQSVSLVNSGQSVSHLSPEDGDDSASTWSPWAPLSVSTELGVFARRRKRIEGHNDHWGDWTRAWKEGLNVKIREDPHGIGIEDEQFEHEIYYSPSHKHIPEVEEGDPTARFAARLYRNQRKRVRRVSSSATRPSTPSASGSEDSLSEDEPLWPEAACCLPSENPQTQDAAEANMLPSAAVSTITTTPSTAFGPGPLAGLDVSPPAEPAGGWIERLRSYISSARESPDLRHSLPAAVQVADVVTTSSSDVGDKIIAGAAAAGGVVAAGAGVGTWKASERMATAATDSASSARTSAVYARISATEAAESKSEMRRQTGLLEEAVRQSRSVHAQSPSQVRQARSPAVAPSTPDPKEALPTPPLQQSVGVPSSCKAAESEAIRSAQKTRLLQSRGKSARLSQNQRSTLERQRLNILRAKQQIAGTARETIRDRDLNKRLQELRRMWA